ncbi:MAG: hypothetical protein H6570_20980 [Lewinellaceae bacterium]|nr:hypothetical protein [Lewinellaceae bacterium]
MKTSFKQAIMGLSAGAMIALPGFLRAQKTASTGNPAQEITARYNKSAANDDGKTYYPEPGKGKYPYTIKYCDLSNPKENGVNEAGDYSFENKEFVIFMRRGRDAKYTAEQYCQLVKDKIFSGENDIPITFMIGKEGAGVNPLMDVYIDGHLGKDPENGDDLFLPGELAKNAHHFVERYWNNHGGKQVTGTCEPIL